jgi:KDO2-lipid IV(A) lauroyltransferase
MQGGRARGQARMVEPDLKGVRALLTALKRNQAAWVLPDQSANTGEGLWMRFLDRPAYMPTLLYRLQSTTGATPLLFACERLSFGRGYRLWIEPVPELPREPAAAAALVNAGIEKLIHRFPSQYLWSYRLHRDQPAAANQEFTA